MSTPDDLALFAFECRRMAAETLDPADRRDWLRLAESWERMRASETAGQRDAAGSVDAISWEEWVTAGEEPVSAGPCPAP